MVEFIDNQLEELNEDELLHLNPEQLVEILKTVNTRLQKSIKELTSELASVRYQLNYHLSKKYGKSSDTVPSEQLSLFDEPETVEDTTEEEVSTTTVKSHTRTTKTSKPLPKELPRERVVIDIDDNQKICSCGCQLQCIGEESSEKLDIIPAKIRVLEIVRPKYACRACEEGVSIADMPKTAIPKGLPTPGTLAHVILSKYQDHLPLYRQETIFQRMGVDIQRNTLCNWVLKCAGLLQPLYELMKQDLLSSSYIQADETPVRVLGSDGKHYMWAYLSRPPDKLIALYNYNESRGGEVVKEFLNGYTKLLQTDGYSGYNTLIDVTHGACWAHARRKYVDIIKNTKKTGVARTIVDYIKELYYIEKEARALSHPDRKTLRQERALKILTELHEYLLDKYPKTPPKSPLGKAMAYNIKLWDKLNVYIKHGEMEIDTNLVENIIRPFALGRRNWLFKGSPRGAEAGCILYSILLTCKLNNIEPYAYMKYILYKLPKIDDTQHKDLLPYNINHDLIDNAYERIWY